jgi:hypothetical protein
VLHQFVIDLVCRLRRQVRWIPCRKHPSHSTV